MFTAFTIPNYGGLNAPIETFAPHFDILGFPCNQFGMQEPGHNHEILNAIRYVRPGGGYIPNFNLSQKVDVNGDTAHPLFNFLKVTHLYLYELWIMLEKNFTNIKKVMTSRRQIAPVKK